MKAVQTMAAIEAAITYDQGARYRQLLGELMPLASDAYRPQSDLFRAHLGASQIGKECGREIWYSFRWATLELFDGRMIRLFNRGHLEEPRMVALLKMIGVTIYQQDANGKQYRMSPGYKGHGGGSMDAICYGVPDVPQTYVLGEFKTHSEKSFTSLEEDGLIKTKWSHYVQTQMYMGDQGLSHTLYLATNKNTDHIYAEIVRADPKQYERYQQRSMLIIDATEPPPKIARDESDWRCRMCKHVAVCHLGKPPHKSCRTCQHSIVLDEGEWGCKWHQIKLTEEMQQLGCDSYDRIT